MAVIDPRLYTGLRKMQRAYDRLLSIRSQVTTAEIALSDQWQADLEPVLRDLYWWPLRNGINEAPENADELHQWLREQYGAATATTVLLLLLRRYQERGVNLAGQMALGEMGISGQFRLTNAQYLEQLDAHAAMLTTQGSEMSLVDTTIDHLATGIVQARKDEGNTLLVLSGMIAGWALLRSNLIAITELTRQVGNGLRWTFGNNGVQWQMFVTREDRAVCLQCLPLHGERMRVNDIPWWLQLPIHTGCRCTYSAILDGWTLPGDPWMGGDL